MVYANLVMNSYSIPLFLSPHCTNVHKRYGLRHRHTANVWLLIRATDTFTVSVSQTTFGSHLRPALLLLLKVLTSCTDTHESGIFYILSRNEWMFFYKVF
jgi:hypothetical protein